MRFSNGRSFSSDATRAPVIVYGGERDYERQGCRVVGWRELEGLALSVVASLLML